jgi:Zn-finger nucleic acid-binding protein
MSGNHPWADDELIRFWCPECKLKLKALVASAGQRTTCPRCHAVLTMPGDQGEKTTVIDIPSVPVQPSPPPLPQMNMTAIPQAYIPHATPIVVVTEQRRTRAARPKKHPITKMLMLIATAMWLLVMVLTVVWMTFLRSLRTKIPIRPRRLQQPLLAQAASSHLRR